jgi:hypothetical protein
MLNRSTFLRCAILTTLAAATAFAADVTGKWTGQAPGPDGNNLSLTFTLKQDGAKLTGSVDAGMGDPLEIKDGKVDGDKIAFTVSFNEMKITHNGILKGDEITLTYKMEGGGGPGGDLPPITLKRVKS